MRIVLWDIDGTLVNTGGAGVRALARAIGSAQPAADALRRMRLDGMTDRRIARTLCAAVRHRDDPSLTLEEHFALVPAAEIDRVLGIYVGALRLAMTSPEGYQVLPGVERTLDALDAQGALHGLATGNVQEGARLKLEHAGLWRRFRFGGFGSDAEDRGDIVRAALARAEELLGRECEKAEFVVVGDTPRDVAAAHEAGVACVAVASGRHSANELADNGADGVLASLDAPETVPMILSVLRRP